MQPFISSFKNTLTHASEMHAFWVHFPIAASVLGLILIIGLIFTGGREPGLRWSCVIVLGVGAIAAYLAATSGEAAANDAAPMLTGNVGDLIESHRAIAQWIWMPLAITALFAAGTEFKMVAVRTSALVLAAIAGLISVVWIVLAAQSGGSLVYASGIGMPGATTAPAAITSSTPPGTIALQHITPTTRPTTRP